MTRILIVGGYGVFGARIAERLAREGDLTLIVAGRSRARAEDLAAALKEKGAAASFETAGIDATSATAEQVAALSPRVVVNASGPFQSQDVTLARAAIGTGAHYVDIADARGFVAAVRDLDAEARKAGVAVISGASSVPGLSSAVVAHFAPRYRRIDRIDIAISPGSGFEPGPATAAAALSYLGRPIRVETARAPYSLFGWQGLSRLHFPGLGLRWSAYCEVPDLDLFPEHYHSLRHVAFRAGLEVPLYGVGLWLLSWPARAGLIRQPERMAPFLSRVRRRLSFLGSNRGGMRVDIRGERRSGRPLHTTWSLAAEDGDGLYVPTTGAVILARKLARGGLSFRGADACFERFTLAEFVSEIADLRIETGPRPLYARILGDRLAALPPAVERLHAAELPGRWRGAARVTHGSSRLARLAAWLTPFPRATSGEEDGFTFTVTRVGDGELWERGFRDGPKFRSWQREKNGRLVESVKGVAFTFAIDAGPEGQRLVLERLRVLGIPLPRVLWPKLETFESEAEGRYRFAVTAELPLGLGPLVAYEGWLEPDV